jgi:TRAP-type mannitol/chloroaromatic compound transport system permease small subunit
MMRGLLALSQGIDRGLEAAARATGWLFLVLIGLIFFDVVTRKAGFQLPLLGSTRLQELEWHMHAILFLGWIGYCYVRNAHVRIDVLIAGLSPRAQAWLELFGIFVFAAPYCLVAIYYSYGFFETSFIQNEASDAPNGLPYRWIVKFFLFAALVGVLLAVASTLFRKLIFLFGPPDLARAANGPTAQH